MLSAEIEKLIYNSLTTAGDRWEKEVIQTLEEGKKFIFRLTLPEGCILIDGIHNPIEDCLEEFVVKVEVAGIIARTYPRWSTSSLYKAILNNVPKSSPDSTLERFKDSLSKIV